ncbi:Alpha/Beta hydrolase protein [Gongronella butleri]|nr:Alpha/Beta hydrolase protein [Gongronella butleri]
MLMRSLILSTAIASVAFAAPTSPSVPEVKVRNGTIQGYHDAHFGHDAFLGIPYAQPPVGALRFQNPAPYNKTWSSNNPLKATTYGDACLDFAFTGDTANLKHSEDCLTLNVVRPAAAASAVSSGKKRGHHHKLLPVGVWIHGGGFQGGGSARDLYNLSYPIAQSEKGGTPIVAVSINYRLGGFGFLASKEASDAGILNAGFKDQIMAVRWVKENIAAFGGDPNQITVWGESAGGISVAALMTAYDGGLEGLFQRGVMESGFSTMFGYRKPELFQDSYDTLAKKAGCTNSQESLDCLRNVDLSTLLSAMNTTGITFNPTLDGDVISQYPRDLLKQGKFMKIPILLGGNMDEGTSFGPGPINTTAQLQKALTTSYPDLKPQSLDGLLQLYSQDPAQGSPYGTGDQFSGGPYGDLFKLGNSVVGDIMVDSSRRLMAETWADAGLDVYSYHWNQTDAGMPPFIGSTHFVEVVYVFANPSTTFPQSSAAPLSPGKDNWALAETMSRSVMAFIATGDPNKANLQDVKAPYLPYHWPKYNTHSPKNAYFKAGDVHTEADTFRDAQITYINTKMGHQFYN